MEEHILRMTDNKVLYEIIVGEDNRKMVKIAQ
jgi:hypothetical protein